MASRIEIRTNVPANTEVGLARTLAKGQAAEALGIHIVEEALLPVSPKMPNPDYAAALEILKANTPQPGDTVMLPPLEIDTPNDHTVDRVLVTYWTLHESSGSGHQ